MDCDGISAAQVADPLTVLCWLWKGWRPVYSAAHVNALARMLAGHMRTPYRLVCVTDNPQGVTECATHPLWPAPMVVQQKRQNCYTRLRVFDPEVGRLFGGRLLSIDLDCLVRADLSPLLTEDTYKAVRGVSAAVNGSMWMLKTGAHANVWRDFDGRRSPKVIARTVHRGRPIGGSDQAWMSIKIRDAPTWGPEDGVQQFSRIADDAAAESARVVFFAEEHKPWGEECARRTPALHAEYMRWLT